MSKLPDYGIDAPIIVRNNLIVGGLACAASILVFLVLRASHSDLASTILSQGCIAGGIMLALAVFMLWSSKFGKFHVRDRLLNSIAWRGSELVLDIGCGRGLALIGAAHRLTTGRATGIDLWSAVDLSGNTAGATLANAQAEGVAHRIAIMTGDARALPYEDAAYDVVVSMTAIHNIKDKAGRRQAVAEAVRVLRPGGSMAVFDIFHAGRYRLWLEELGMHDVRMSRPIFLWLMPGRLLTARKP